MIPPRHQPTTCTRRPPVSSLDRSDRVGQDVLDPVLEPEVAVGERDLPVLHAGRSGGRARACARPSSSRGAGRSRSSARPAAAPAAPAGARRGGRRRRQVAVDRALRRLVDDPRRRAAQVGDAAAEHHVERVGRRAATRYGELGRVGHRACPMLRTGRAGAERGGSPPARRRSARAPRPAGSGRTPVEQLVGGPRGSASTRWREPRWVTIRSRSPHTSSTGHAIASSSKRPSQLGQQPAAVVQERATARRLAVVRGERARPPRAATARGRANASCAVGLADGARARRARAAAAARRAAPAPAGRAR